MANNYFTPTTLTAFTTAKANDVNTNTEGIEDGFDLLPTPKPLGTGPGWTQACYIADGTDEDHGTNIEQIRDGDFFVGADNSSSVNTYAITLTPAPSAYTAGMIVMFKVPSATTNTGASTLNVNALGAKSIITTSGETLANKAGALSAGYYAWLQYDGTNFQLITPSYADLASASVTVPALDTTKGYSLIRQNSGGTAYESGAPSVVPPSGVSVTGGIVGLVLSNDTDTDHDIQVSAGACVDSTGTVHMQLATAMTKQIDAAWAVGDDAGGLFSGSVANSTLYNVFLIRKDSDGSIDVGFDTSATAANIPSGYTYYRWIGYVLTDGSANIRNFTMGNDWLVFNTAFTLIANAQHASLTEKDISAVVPNQVEKIIIACFSAAGNDIAYVGVNSTEAEMSCTSVATGGGVAWSTALTKHETDNAITETHVLNGSFYLDTDNVAMGVGLKAVGIKR